MFSRLAQYWRATAGGTDGHARQQRPRCAERCAGPAWLQQLLEQHQ